MKHFEKCQLNFINTMFLVNAHYGRHFYNLKRPFPGSNPGFDFLSMHEYSLKKFIVFTYRYTFLNHFANFLPSQMILMLFNSTNIRYWLFFFIRSTLGSRGNKNKQEDRNYKKKIYFPKFLRLRHLWYKRPWKDKILPV